MARRLRQDASPVLRRNRAEAIAGDAKQVARSAFTRAGFQDETLVLHWPDIAGAEIAAMARPIRLAQKENGGELTLAAEPAAAVFLQHDSRALCERINLYLGRPAVRKLRFVPADLIRHRAPRKSPSSPLSGPEVDDPVRRFEGPERLKRALMSLASHRQRSRSNTGD